MRKNPENKPLRITYLENDEYRLFNEREGAYVTVLSNLAIAESNLVRAGKDSALPHFIAIVKEIEKVLGIKFEQTGD